MNFLQQSWIIDLVYLISVFFFILGLKRLSSPRTARSGNAFSMLGMLVAIIITFLDKKIITYEWIISGIVIGGSIGILMAKTVKMTGMPQMVAFFNGFGGSASSLVALSQYYGRAASLEGDPFTIITLILSILIGTITFSGSMVAFAKLQGIIGGSPILYPLQKTLNFLLFAFFCWASFQFFTEIQNERILLIITAISFILGIMLTIPIGGADMPVVVSLLNSYSGLAVAMTGFILKNNALIVVGSLVGASGLILTNIMCKGMNRSLANVLFGGFGSDLTKTTRSASDQQPKRVKRYSAEEVAMILDVAERVIFVPGYGLAVSQAQYAVKKLASKLIDKGVDVRFGIHPVAGRMPGHMNVLLAEAGIEYDLLYDRDQINDEFSRADVSVIIGANDVVNPDAKENKNSPIYGMPILDVEASKAVVVLKRSMNPGFAGIENNLFYRENTIMVFGDAKTTLDSIIASLDEL